jgi:hypothetical protein
VIVVRSLKSSIIGLAVTVVLLAAAPAAFAQSGWWHLTSGTRPGYIKPGSGHDEVQELATSPGSILGTPTTAFELYVGNEEVGYFATEPVAKELGLQVASAASIQAALEGFYGKGNVTVTGGDPGAVPGSITPLVITSVGARAYQPVETLKAFDITGEGSATVTVAATGRPDGEVYVTAENVGNATINAQTSPVQIVDNLPRGVKAVGMLGTEPGHHGAINERTVLNCTVEPQPTCSVNQAVGAFTELELRIAVVVEPGAATLNEASISGGSVPSASFSRALTLSGEPTPAGAENYELTPEEELGVPTTQAGSHPFQLTTTLMLNQGADTSSLTPSAVDNDPEPNAEPIQLAKDVNFKWPAGLIGNPSSLEQCSTVQFSTYIYGGDQNLCPNQSVVGVASVTVNTTKGIFNIATFTVPLFNLTPRVGEPARFGFTIPIAGAQVYIDTSVRTGSDYGITVSVNNITQTAGFISSSVTVWGVPGDPRHNAQRGWACLDEATKLTSLEHGACEPPEQVEPPPFLQMPTSCTGPLVTSVESDSWNEPSPEGQQRSLPGSAMPALDGCNRAPFDPSLVVTPDATEGSTPTGLNVDVHNPQEGSLNPNGLVEPDVKDIKVTLPEGVAINPAGADGLQACSEALVGFTGFNELEAGLRTAAFTDKLPGSNGSGETFEQGVDFCSDASKIGTVKITTPLLPNSLNGSVYLATQDTNPFGSLVAMYVVAEDPVSGVLVKLAGEVSLTSSGQIVATFANNPQLPFEDAELHFFGGERAPLATPARCGAYTTSASFVPWTGNAAAAPSSTFDIASGPNGSACPGSSLPFSPSLTAGTTSNQAGGFSPFTMTMSREDGNQNLQSVQLHMPSGLEGVLSSVALCGEEQANAGTCGAESQIGETTVSVGLGGDPFSVKGGRVYITGPYDGAPFGLSIVNPAVAGPFNLGNVVVRAKIEVDPRTAELTITTDSSGQYAIPTILDGIPLEIKHVNVTINRPGFTFNPTSCEKTEIGGNLASAEGSSQALAVSFQPTNCAVLKFTPSLSVKTAAYASKAKGASLQFKIAYPKGAMGTQSWFNEAKFDIPKQLPARLSTIQQACTATTFETNRAACPKHSIIGSAIVHTPILPVPLEGPVYFVSYGGAKFPDAVLVLKGYGLTIELHGNTFINGTTGVTSATFKALPDVPFESIEVNLPSGEYSEFGANLPAKAHFDFCGQKLTMPTFFKASNGLEIKQASPVTITGCTKPAKHKKARKKAKDHKATHKYSTNKK